MVWLGLSVALAGDVAMSAGGHGAFMGGAAVGGAAVGAGVGLAASFLPGMIVCYRDFDVCQDFLR
jgi:hypothetical protein